MDSIPVQLLTTLSMHLYTYDKQLGTHTAHNEADVKDREDEVVAKVAVIPGQEGEVVLEKEGREVDQAKEVGPDVNCLVRACQGAG